MKKSKKEIAKYKKLYKQLSMEAIYCPFLACDVDLTREGWNHLLFKRGKSRKYKDMIRRMELLAYVPGIIGKSHFFQYFRKECTVLYYGIEVIVADDIEHQKEFQVVRVILRKNDTGKTIFYSVMDKSVRIKT